MFRVPPKSKRPVTLFTYPAPCRAEMVRAAVEPAPRRGGAGVRIHPFEAGQQRWVDVDQPAFPCGDEIVRQQPHIACKRHEIASGVTQDRVYLCVEQRPSAMPAMIE